MAVLSGVFVDLGVFVAFGSAASTAGDPEEEP